MFTLLSCTLLAIFLPSKANEINWHSIPSASNSSQCIFRPQANDLSCRVESKIVACPAIFENSFVISIGLNIFGMSRDPSKANKIETTKFRLYPRHIENQTYFDFDYNLDNQTKNLYLHHSALGSESSGIRVVDLFCWFRLVSLFEKLADEHLITTQERSNASLLGEILVARKPAQKKWIGWAIGWNHGWGWGLTGWGLPLWGLPWIA